MTNNSLTSSRRGWIWVASVAVILLLIFYSYVHQTPIKVHAVGVKRDTIRSVVSTNGKVEPVLPFESHAPIATTVKRVLAREGDYVHKGQLLLELDDALDRLAGTSAQAAELVKLRFYAGLTLREAAAALGLPNRSADRLWAFARAWLIDALDPE